MVDYPKGVYFLTSSTFLHYPYFQDAEQKEIVLNQIKKLKKERDIQICSFSIQINHCHLIFYVKKEKDVTLVKQLMHGGTSYFYRKKYRMKYQELWGTQKIMRIWSNEMYWKIVAYVCGNLLKHREVGTFGELKANPFSSYGHFAEKYGDDFMKEGIYRIIDVAEDADGGPNWDDIKQARLARYGPA